MQTNFRSRVRIRKGTQRQRHVLLLGQNGLRRFPVQQGAEGFVRQMLRHQQKGRQHGSGHILRARLAGDPQAQRVLPLSAPGRSHHAFQPIRRLKAVLAFRGLTKHIGHAVIGVI